MQTNQLAVLADDIVAQKQEPLQTVLDTLGITYDDYRTADKTPVLFTLWFNETSGNITINNSLVPYSNIHYSLYYN